MNVDHLLTSTAIATFVTQGTTRDSRGDLIDETTTRTFKCWLYQAGRSEDTNNANVQQESWQLILESAAAGLDGWDRVQVDGVAYEFDGPPWPATNPRTQITTHVEATVRRTR